MSNRPSRKRWEKRRSEVIARDGGRCVLCHSAEQLTVHHIRAYTISRDNRPSNLVTLCESCHNTIEHAIQRAAQWVAWAVTAPIFRLARLRRISP